MNVFTLLNQCNYVNILIMFCLLQACRTMDQFTLKTRLLSRVCGILRFSFSMSMNARAMRHV